MTGWKHLALTGEETGASTDDDHLVDPGRLKPDTELAARPVLHVFPDAAASDDPMTAFMAIPILGEWPSAIEWIAIALISIGVYVVSGGPLPRARA